MAPKRTIRLNDLPSVSSEEEKEQESEESEEEQETNTKPDSEDESEESSEEDDEEEEEEGNHPIPPPVKKPTVATPKPQSSSESQGSESESDSGDTQTASAFTVKPILSKPMTDPKPVNSESITQSKPSAKRPAEAKQNGKDSRGKKSKVSKGDDEDGVVEEKKSAINRLWSEEDEIVILEGMINYQVKKGADPYADLVAFHEFIKELLHVNVSKNQLTDKIRRLKKKYQNNAEKGENGEDPVFSRPHEHKSFELSKKIWGGGTSNGVDDNVKSGSGNSKAKKSGKVHNSVALVQPKEEAKVIVPFQEPLKDEIKVDQIDYLPVQSENYVSLSLPEDVRDALKENMGLVGTAATKEMEKKRKNFQVGVLEMYSKRLAFIHEQAKLVLDAMNASMS